MGPFLSCLFVICILASAILFPVFILYVKEAYLWRRIVKQDLKKLRKDSPLYQRNKREALHIVQRKCTMVFQGKASGFDDFSDIRDYINRIALCFHPDALYPELQVTTGHILYCLERSFDRFDRLFERPGFSDISSLSVRKLKYLKLLHKDISIPGGQTQVPFRSKLYFMKHIPRLVCANCLVAELYLYIGLLAVEVYDEKLVSVVEDRKQVLEETLKELSLIKTMESHPLPDDIIDIRNSIVGFPSVLMSDPTFDIWKSGLNKAAGVIASDFFPDSESPMDEARIGPLLFQLRSWLSVPGNGERIPVAGRLFKLRLETLFQTKTISDTLIPAKIRKVIINTHKTYSLLKWPLNIYMWASKGAFWKIAVDAGWFAGRKAMLVFVFGRSFDRAVRELETVYRLSSRK